VNVTPVQTLVTSTTTCGTCCDYFAEANVNLASEVTVTELLVRFQGGPSSECADDLTCDQVVEAGGPGYTRADEGTVEICLSDSDGIDGPIALSHCSATAGFFVQGPAEVLRALDEDFRPIDPAPVVLVDDE
jgi:hypothetical protein